MIREYISKKTRKTRYTACVRKRGHRSTKTFGSRAAAQEWASKEARRLLTLAWQSDRPAIAGRYFPLSKVIEEFERERLPLLAGSWASYFKWIKHFLGKERLGDLTAQIITKARSDYLAHPTKGNGKQKPLKPASGNKFTTAVAMLLNYAIEQRWIGSSPMQGWKNLSEAAYQRERWLDDDERRKLLSVAAKSKSIMLPTVILVAIYTGYRKEVVRTLKWESIDLKMGVINVPQKYSLQGKRGKPRAFNLPIVQELRSLLEQHRARLEAVGVKSDFVFPSPSNPLVPWDFTSAFESAVKKAKIHDFHFHDLRHSAATYLTRAGVSTQVIQRFLGHMDSRITERYIKRPHEYMKSEMSRALVNIIDKSPQIQFDEENSDGQN